MGGVPIFQGTRVPIANVIASHRAGFNLDQLREAYPFLTQEFVDAALSYVPSHGTPHPSRSVDDASRVPIRSKRVPLAPWPLK